MGWLPEKLPPNTKVIISTLPDTQYECLNAMKVRTKKAHEIIVLIDFSLTVKAATLIFISGRGLAFSSAEGNQALVCDV